MIFWQKKLKSKCTLLIFTLTPVHVLFQNNEKYTIELNFHYLPSAVFLSLSIVGPSKCLKRIIQTKVNRAKNPKWPEANQLAICKHGRGFEIGTTENKSTKRSGQDLNSEPPNCKSSRALTTRLCCLPDRRKDKVPERNAILKINTCMCLLNHCLFCGIFIL